MTKRITTFLAAIAALAAVALGASAIAGAVQNGPSSDKNQATQEPNEKGEAAEGRDEEREDKGEQATGPEADRAKQAALASTGGGTATAVERDEPEGAEKEEPGDKSDPGEDKQEGFQSPAGSAWEVEVTKSDGSNVEVYLDKDFKVLDTAPAEQE